MSTATQPTTVATAVADSGNDNGGGNNSPLSDTVAIAALVISLIALVTTVVQLTQTLIPGAKGLPNRDQRIMGRWAKFTSRRFRWWQLRLEIDFDAPVIFLARHDNSQGPVKGGTPIWYAT